MSTLTSPSPLTASQPKSELEDFDGKISLARAFPYGLQHVLAMFVANLAPIAIIASAAGFDACNNRDAYSKCNDCCRHRHFYTVIPYLAHRCPNAHRHGCELHLRDRAMRNCRQLWLSRCGRSRYRWRFARGRFGLIR